MELDLDQQMQEKIVRFIIEVGSVGPSFIGEGTMIHTPTLVMYCDKFVALVKEIMEAPKLNE